MPCNNLPEPNSPAVCEENGGGLLLPLGGNAEHQWPNELRAVLYLLGLLWCFAGVAIIADVFMAAIEKITSKKIIHECKKTKKKRTISVWNPTVANLTLMALGSSAPEILLNVIGIFPTFVAGDLGPGTIVGSAAFNLLMIIAVCVVSIPAGEVRRIKDMGVFIVTGVFSVFAYVWLLIILIAISPDVVEWWEGVVTFLFFWILLVLAWLADTGKLPGCKKTPTSGGIKKTSQSTPEEIKQMQILVQERYGKTRSLTLDEVSALIEFEYGEGNSRARQRVQATRAMSGGKAVLDKEQSNRRLHGARLSRELTMAEGLGNAVSADDAPIVEFERANHVVLESVGFVDIKVHVRGKVDQPFTVNYKTRDDSAKKGEDYVETSGTLTFTPTEKAHTIKVKIVKSEGYEENEQFYLDLEESNGGGGSRLGQKKTTVVNIIDEDRPGILAFMEEQSEVIRTGEEQTIPVKITRKKGHSGQVSCKVVTESDSAVGGKDFEEVEDTVTFKSGETEQTVNVKILANVSSGDLEHFRVIIKDAEGGATFDETTDGDADSCVLTIYLKQSPDKMNGMNSLPRVLRPNMDIIQLGNANYREQFVQAVFVGGSHEAQKEAKWHEWVPHMVTLPWKVMFATVPPADYAGGWLCFSVALFMIGFVTVLIGDLAELLGCVVGMEPSVTAITLVAVGTSLPDTFASRTAATQDPYADNSIGNVTGSNSVNVFLGLGLPWSIAALFWAFGASCSPGDRWSEKYPAQAALYPEGIFVVKAGSLGTSVSVFSCFATMCLLTLVGRRYLCGGELGGSKVIAWLSAGFFVSLWVLYIVLSIVLGGSE